MKRKYIYYLLWGLVVFLLFPNFRILYMGKWHALDYTHAYFILPVSLWLVYRQRENLARAFADTQGRFGRLSLCIFTFGLLMYLFGWHQTYLVICMVALIPLLYGLLGFIYGQKVQRMLLFPILYLLLLVPPPFAILDNATLPLRYISAFGAEKAFALLNFPIQRQGLMYVIGQHKMTIDQGCSGFRSLITMFSLALIYVYINRDTMFKKTVLAMSVIPLAIMGNIVRIMAISLIGVKYGPEAASGFMHYFSGAVIFLFIVLGFVGIEVIWTRIAGGRDKGIEGVNKGEEFEWFE